MRSSHRRVQPSWIIPLSKAWLRRRGDRSRACCLLTTTVPGHSTTAAIFRTVPPSRSRIPPRSILPRGSPTDATDSGETGRSQRMRRPDPSQRFRRFTDGDPLGSCVVTTFGTHNLKSLGRGLAALQKPCQPGSRPRSPVKTRLASGKATQIQRPEMSRHRSLPTTMNRLEDWHLDWQGVHFRPREDR